jgi:hypothetical protein
VDAALHVDPKSAEANVFDGAPIADGAPVVDRDLSKPEFLRIHAYLRVVDATEARHARNRLSNPAIHFTHKSLGVFHEVSGGCQGHPTAAVMEE